MAMHYTYSGTKTHLHGGIYTMVPGTGFRNFDASGTLVDERADFRHVSGDPEKYLQHAGLHNLLPVGNF